MATLSEMLEWLKVDYAPLQYSIPDTTIQQNIVNAFRYWNNYSAYRHTEMASLTGTTAVLSKYMKAVANVIPASLPGTINIQDFPLWSLLGIQVIDNLNTDLMMLTDTYKNYNIYMGKDFQTRFIPASDPNDTNGGGKLYITNPPPGCTAVAVTGAKRIFEDEDIPEQDIYDFILRYAKCLCRIAEGNVLRKASIVGVNNDGQENINEAKEDLKELQLELSNNSRWIVFGGRI